MFSAWQAGVWKALSRRLQPDLVVGTSAGALNGWVIASRADPQEIIDAWTDPRTATLMSPHWSWRGIFDPTPLCELSRDLFTRYSPKVPFAATLVEVPRLVPRIFRDGEITWQHLAAACSIPGCFPPVRLNGRLYVDGGLLGALPLWAAAELGAQRVVAVDALPLLPSRWLRGITRAARVFGKAPTAPANLEVVMIRPSETLGTLRDAWRWSIDNVHRWVALGERDGERALIP
jgi:NTE family protein